MTTPTPATLPPPGDLNTLYLVDLSGYIFRAYHALPPLSNERGEPTHAVYGTATMMMRLLKERRPTSIALAMDSRSPSFRKEIDPNYKANRPAPPPDLSQQMQRTKEVCAAMGLCILQQEGVEADDIIATYTHLAKALGKRVVIASSDKDLLQLIDERVVAFDPLKGRVFGPFEVEQKLGVPPRCVRDFLALTGDSSDNIPGVPSIGPKTATTLLTQWGTLDNLYAHLDALDKPKLRETLKTHREAAVLSQQLVTLKHDLDLNVPIEDLNYKGPDTPALKSVLTELGFTKLLDSWGEGWVGGAAAKAEQAKQHPVVRLGQPDTEMLQAFASAEMLTVLATHRRGEEVLFVTTSERSLMMPITQGVVEGLLKLIESGVRTVIPCIKPFIKRFKLPQPCLDRIFDIELASYLITPESRAHGYITEAERRLGETLQPLEALEQSLPQDDAVFEQHAAAHSLAMLKLTKLLNAILDELDLRKLYEDIERPVAWVLADMEQCGITIDVERLKVLSVRLSGRLERLEKDCTEMAGYTFNLSSTKQLEKLLFDELRLPVIKKTKTGRSTDQEVLEALSAEHPLPQHILEHRKLCKLKSTYVDALPSQVDPKTGRIHTSFNQTVAATGRLSSSDPNLQNIPIRDTEGQEIRRAFIPQKGWTLISADYSQVELRILAHLSDDPALIEAFNGKEDVHARTARALFNVAPQDITKAMRNRAKTVNFAVIYGQSDFTLAKNLEITRAEAKHYMDAFFERYAGVKAFLVKTVRDAEQNGYVSTLFGRRRPLPDLRNPNKNLRAAAERMAFNTPVQGTAADILKLAMIRVDRALRDKGFQARMLLTVHDELVLEAPFDECDAVKELLVHEMQSAVTLKVPLTVECGSGPNWADILRA